MDSNGISYGILRFIVEIELQPGERNYKKCFHPVINKSIEVRAVKIKDYV